MGLNISFGTCYGIEIYSTIDKKDGLLSELGRETIYETLYNERTGEPFQRKKIFFEWMLEFNYDFMKWKKGDKISTDDLELYGWEGYIFTDLYEEFNSDDERLIINRQCIGVKSFIGREPYVRPQDMCFELISDLENASEEWKKLFPNIPGKHLMYLHVSY